MEVWQAAALLGVDENRVELTDGFVDTFNGRPITEADRRRLEKFAGVSGESEDITGQVMRQMGIHTG